MIQHALNFFKAAIPVVAISTPAPEELSAIERIVRDIAEPLNRPVFLWDFGRGLQKVTVGDSGVKIDVQDSTRDDPLTVLPFIADYPDPAIFVLLDFHPFLTGERMDLRVVRTLKNLCFALKQSRKRLILLGQDVRLPDEFGGLIQELHNPLPDAIRVRSCVESVLTQLHTRRGIAVPKDDEQLQRLVRSAQGLTEEEISDALRLAGLTEGAIDETSADVVRSMKIAKLRKLGVEFSEPPSYAVGGLESLKLWIAKRTRLFSAQGSAANIPPVKGLLLVGPPGAGKSLVSRTIAQQWGIPNLAVDVGSLYGGIVGESESNLRNLLRAAEACAPAVLFMDEIDKAFAGVGGPSGDSGVSQRLFGRFLTWLNDKTAQVFVVATANNVLGLPPELLRKGRFDEIFFVDLPACPERVEILSIHLQRYGACLDRAYIEVVAAATRGFSGAELAEIVKEAAIEAFYLDGRPSNIDPELLLNAAKQTVPLSKSREEELGRLRDWARNNARQASPSSDDDPAGGHRDVWD
ncbi:AAA family ATPase [Gloeobacter kilaueensis]|uniref:Uncharacterized AAA domain-containing protein ycf46 n=1 Tax=Gloeobacter kilaueensis (strain ATCC BAA-2537 / CCAP 1431/1 / ULC 316 / JS1) TaxID=1183438 RepID=U5QGI7_GLOK1|nr:AAA family ATPase [Gloeobacter kilaueensis]AGY57983.1 ATP-dependent metalloprotease [Gloeobacter kilaueensis JS1]